MIKISFLIIVVLILTVALISGLLFSFTNAVCPGLKHLADLEFLKAMKSINKEILNPIFLFCFFSPLLFYPLMIYSQQNGSSCKWLLIAGLLSYILVVVITAAINVPLNNQLEKLDLSDRPQTGFSEFRNAFENRWTFWNNIRTVLSVSSLIFIILHQFVVSKYNIK